MEAEQDCSAAFVSWLALRSPRGRPRSQEIPPVPGDVEKHSHAPVRLLAGLGDELDDVKNVPGPTGLNQLWVRLKSTARKSARGR